MNSGSIETSKEVFYDYQIIGHIQLSNWNEITIIFVVSGSTNVGDQLPTGQLSVVPWRRTGVKYTNNEAYFDVIEEIDAIIDKSGRCFYSVLKTRKYNACYQNDSLFKIIHFNLVPTLCQAWCQVLGNGLKYYDAEDMIVYVETLKDSTKNCQN